MITRWISEKLAPAAERFSKLRAIDSIVGGFQFSMPIILIGAIFQIVGNIVTLAIGGEGDIISVLNILNNLSFGILGIVFSYGIAYSNARHQKINPNTAGILAISLFLVLAKPEFVAVNPMTSQFQIDFSRLGAQASVLSIIAGLSMGEVLGLFINRGWTIRGETLPDFIKDWFQPLIPATLLIAIAWMTSYLFNLDLYTLISTSLAPLIKVGNTLPGLIIYQFIWIFSWFLGIHPLVLLSFTLPLIFGNLAENSLLAASGLAPTVANGFNINNIGTLFGFILYSGTGCFLALNIMMLRSKSHTLKNIGRASIVSSIFNISEPILFGVPVAFNPILGIPMIIIQSVVNTTIVFVAMSLNLVAIPFNTTFIPFLPMGISGFLYNNDWRGIFLTLFLFAINYLIYYPFFKIFERQTIRKEEKEVV